MDRFSGCGASDVGSEPVHPDFVDRKLSSNVGAASWRAGVETLTRLVYLRFGLTLGVALSLAGVDFLEGNRIGDEASLFTIDWRRSRAGRTRFWGVTASIYFIGLCLQAVFACRRDGAGSSAALSNWILVEERVVKHGAMCIGHKRCQ